MKDNFSNNSEIYAQFRPAYPPSLFEYIATHCAQYENAWDCGTGNGQVAIELCKYFKHVYATDISQNQINNAYQNDKISYRVESAESCSSPDQTFDLITIAQAIHWFDFDVFYYQVRRTLKPDGLLAIIGYGFIQTDDLLNTVLTELYAGILGSFWDPERKLIDEEYKTIPFPFREIATPAFSIDLEWSFNHLMGYLYTWSAVEHYKNAKNIDPIDMFRSKIKNAWGPEETKKTKFPVFLRLGTL